jgi:hypothetical protein
VKGYRTIIGRGRPREHPKSTSDHVTFRGSPTGDVWWRHFRWKGPNRADIAPLLVAHAHTLPRGHPSGSRDLRSLPVAMVLVLLYYILYDYYSKNKTRETVVHAHAITSGQDRYRKRDFRSEPFMTSGGVSYGQGRFQSRDFQYIHLKC